MWQVFQSDSASRAQSFSGVCDAPQKFGMMFETIVEPIFLVFEANQYTSGFSMSRNHDFLGLGEAQEARQVVLDLS
jgi:hypothetical protein